MADHKQTKWDKAAVVFQGIAALAIPVSIIALILSVSEFGGQQARDAAHALDQQRQATLQSYFDDMSALVLNHNLSSPRATPAVKALAIARTDTAVRNLDGGRKGILVRYLWEANLITGRNPVVTLHKVNLDGANFKNAALYGADLGTNFLVKANFQDANPYGSDLNGADLSKADLSGSNLSCLPITHHLDFSAGGILAEPGIESSKAIMCTHLEDANLRGANLQDADLIGANLTGASLDGANLQGVIYNSRPLRVTIASGNTVPIPATQWPSNFHPSGPPCVNC
jgi:uncharacterized protein YjbI with pentapeptide repeats